MAGVRLHREHGLNPTLPVCFWCGTETGEVALLGAKYPKRAPQKMVLDIEPCDGCKVNMAKGVVLIHVTKDPIQEGIPEIAYGAHPTGDWVVMTEDAIERIISPPEKAKEITTAGKALLETETWKALGLDHAQDYIAT